MLSLAAGMADTGDRVDLVLARAKGEYMDEIPEHVRLIDLGCKGTAKCIPALTKYLKRERPDGMVSALSRANVAAIVARKLAQVPQRFPKTLRFAG